ncbi:DUF2767 family protein [Mesorhizobium sp. CGMCC 1.15528]|uniref:DUF2767 family protein n=1 Tax=Mesorhizobium zhangyense TaxID=1776730 RepID=A0A7C9VHA6_9HYPH|nr:DUF2767 family protein [Mesorhizobium zhangyense]
MCIGLSASDREALHKERYQEVCRLIGGGNSRLAGQSRITCRKAFNCTSAVSL